MKSGHLAVKPLSNSRNLSENITVIVSIESLASSLNHLLCALDESRAAASVCVSAVDQSHDIPDTPL